MSEREACSVIYLTTACNLECEYCYEARNRKENPIKWASKEDMDDYLQKNSRTEQPKTLVIFGGEPFLAWKEINYLVDQIIEKYSREQFTLNITTNGIWCSKEENVKKLLELMHKLTTNSSSFISPDISYDASGHYRRVFPDGGSSKEEVEKAIDNFNKYKIPLRIRYTIHKGNYDKVLQDAIYIALRFKPEKIVYSFAWTEIDKIFPDKTLDEIFQIYKTYMHTLYEEFLERKIMTSFCDFVCDICHIPCINNGGKKDDFYYTYKVPEKKDFIKVTNHGQFDHFNKEEE
jgi:sulfatase maturation enzyme AslB (radical SAM superfamily)